MGLTVCVALRCTVCRAAVLHWGGCVPRGCWAVSGTGSSSSCRLGVRHWAGRRQGCCWAQGVPLMVRVSGPEDEEAGRVDTRPVCAAWRGVGGPGWTPCHLMLPVSVLSPQNPDIVLVHYLNVPAIEDCGKPCGPILCSINTDKKEWAKWTKEELIGQLKPMCE